MFLRDLLTKYLGALILGSLLMTWLLAGLTSINREFLATVWCYITLSSSFFSLFTHINMGHLDEDN